MTAVGSACGQGLSPTPMPPPLPCNGDLRELYLQQGAVVAQLTQGCALSWWAKAEDRQFFAAFFNL